MTEEQIFLAALDQPDETARAAYLDSTCGMDTPLRQHIEELLAAHFRSGEFLNVPAARQVKGDAGPVDTVTMRAASGDGTVDDEAEVLPFLTPSSRPDSLGRIGHYEVLQVLGKGGFGIVLRAFDDILQRVVAVKVLAPQIAATSPARKRFLREARTSAQLRHENIVQVYEVVEQPLPYLVMEFIPGETLQERLDRTGPLDVLEVVRIGRQIAEGLAAAHGNDLIHRDIKPGNILMEGGHQRVKITDFGLARAADDASISQSGIIAGTPMYMAPEQALGQTLDQRADLFSLGSVLYQMVAGRPPFRANSTVAVLKRVAEDTPREIRELIPETPPWLCDIIGKLHQKSADNRYQSAREVADVLADCEAQLKSHSKIKDFSRIPRSRVPRKSIPKWLIPAALVVVVLTVAMSIVLRPNRTREIRYYARTERPKTSASNLLVNHGQHIPNWGVVVDPKGDCTVDGTKSELTFIIPAGTHDLNPTPQYNDVSAPRVVQAWADDFRIETRVEAFNSQNNSYPGFVGAGLLLWHDDKNFIRFMRSVNAGLKLQMVHLECFQDGRMVFSKVMNIGHEPISLRAVRKGAVYSFSHSANGSEWNEVRLQDPVRFPNAIWLGVVAANSTSKAFRVAFDQFSLSKPAADPRDTELSTVPPPFAVAIGPFDPNQARNHQEAWAKHLGVPVEFTNSMEMRFRLIPPGEFMMGSSLQEIEHTRRDLAKNAPEQKEWQTFVASESPQHNVVLKEPFYLGIHEVRQRDYQAVMDANPSEFVRSSSKKDIAEKLKDFDTSEFAVENVSWIDATEFCRKASEREQLKPVYFRAGDVVTRLNGNGYRLPTEAEWEYACRAGTTTMHHSAGRDELSSVSWLWANSDQRMHMVGELKPNSFGLFDMHGNASEFVEDAWTADYYQQFMMYSATDPSGASVSNGDNFLRVTRGGDWHSGALQARSGSRFASDSRGRNQHNGFRVALSVEAVKQSLQKSASESPTGESAVVKP